MKLTPVLIVESIEPSLAFWTERLGFQKTVEVPDGDHLSFVILAREGAELMMQTVASVRNDEPQFAPASTGGPDLCPLFVEVDDFEDVCRRLNGYPIVMAERKTFYGMREIGVRDPAGHIVVFAARVAEGQSA
jgi:uncharacterized glyoxalase superfamily protein PhnB